MKIKIIAWCTVAALVLGFVGLTFALKGDKSINYGMASGNIGFSDDDIDITDSVIGNNSFKISENDDFIFSLDGEANPVIEHKGSGKVWKSVSDSSAGGGKFSSALILNYYSDNATKITLYSKEQAVDKNQAKVFDTKDGVRVEYIFGELIENYIYPEMITKERMDKFVENLDEEDADYLLRRYRLYVLSEYEEAEREYLLSEYPKLKKEDLYVLSDMSTKLVKKKTDEIFRKAGYTEEDKALDNGDFTSKKENPQTFKVALNYALTDNGFKVTVNSDECDYYTDYPLTGINVLPYFDSFGEEDKGYFVLPSGSGALLNVSDYKKETIINIPIYGQNLAVETDIKNVNEHCALPFFGQYKNESGYLCMLQNGSQQAQVVVDKNNYSSGVSADFSLIDNGSYSMTSSNPVQLFANGESEKTFSVEYVLFDKLEKETAYSKMAQVYRKRLIEQGILENKTEKEDSLFVAQFSGSVNYDKNALGFIPVNKEQALTTFEDVKEIVGEISEYTGENLNVLLTGWNQKGLNRQKLGELEFSKALGGKKGYKELSDYLKKKGISSYLDVNFSMTENFSDDGFSVSSEASRGINNSIIYLNVPDYLTNGFSTSKYNLLSPKFFTDIMEKYLSDENIKSAGINVSDLTSVLYGDYTDSSVFGRKNAMNQVEKSLEMADKKEISISGKSGNLYALNYLNLMTDIPYKSAEINAFYRDIPFVQTVLHGYKNYVSELVNDSENIEKTVLHLIESGSGLYYNITAKSFDKLFDTEYQHIYNTNYSYLKEEMQQSYEKLSTALKGLGNKEIAEHRYINNEVVKVTYENGTEIYVNYGNKDYAVNDSVVKAMDYLRID